MYTLMSIKIPDSDKKESVGVQYKGVCWRMLIYR